MFLLSSCEGGLRMAWHGLRSDRENQSRSIICKIAVSRGAIADCQTSRTDSRITLSLSKLLPECICHLRSLHAKRGRYASALPGCVPAMQDPAVSKDQVAFHWSRSCAFHFQASPVLHALGYTEIRYPGHHLLLLIYQTSFLLCGSRLDDCVTQLFRGLTECAACGVQGIELLKALTLSKPHCLLARASQQSSYLIVGVETYCQYECDKASAEVSSHCPLSHFIGDS